MSPSIHHSVSDTVPTLAPISRGVDHVVPPSVEREKYSLPGLRSRVTGSVGNAWYRTSSVPLGWETIGAMSAPPSGKCGLIGLSGLHFLPPSVDFWTTALRSPPGNEQLPIGEQMIWISDELGP